MSTDLDLFTGLPVRNSLAVWADDARQAASVAVSLAPTPFVPQSLRAVRTSRDETDAELNARTASNVTAAILTGQEVGLTPMASLRSIVVIQGTPAMTALAMRGLVQAAGHDVWKVESNDRRAVYAGRRRGSDIEERSVWTIERATKLGLTGKQNWKTQPEAMLIARATSEVCRLVGADVLLGLPYSVEEIADTVESEPQRTARRRAQREPASMPEPELPTATAPEPTPMAAPEPEFDPDPPPEPITPKQLAALNAAMTQDLGITERAEKLAYLSKALGREVGSSKDVTHDEASHLLDRISREPQKRARILPVDPPSDPPGEPAFDEPPAEFQGETVERGQ